MFTSKLLKNSLIRVSLLILCSFTAIYFKMKNCEGDFSIKGKNLLVKERKEPISNRKISLLVFFSVECNSCYKPVLEINNFYDKIASKVEVMGITRDDIQSIRVFKDRFRIKFPIFYDKLSKYHKKFKVKIIPCRILLKEDKIIYEDDPYEALSHKENKFDRIMKEILLNK